MEDFNPRSPIRLSDIDNLLQESIFESSDGAKLVEYLKKKRGGGRVRLQNIFQQVPVQRAQFNFNLDTSEPTPLPESPQPTTSNGNNVAEVVVTNGGDVQQETAPAVVVSTVVPNGGSVSPRVPIVIMNDLNSVKKPAVKQIVLKSPGPMNTLSRQLLINQYQRTNAAKCELLKQLASSTPKPDSNGSLGRMSTFTTSISPITEGERSPMPPVEEIPSSQPVASPVHVIVVPPAASQEVLVPCSQPILAPCSQAVPTDATPKKVVVLKTVTEVDEVIIPETPSPVKVVTESPKAPPNHIQPRRLSTTFKQMEKAEEAAYINSHITSDESEGEEDEENKTERGSNSVLLKSILKDTSMYGGRSRHSMRVSFSKQLVQQREISPAPDIPEAVNYLDSNSSDDSDVSESEDGEEDDYQVVDEVYTDDDTEDAANLEHYEELKDRICELNNSHNSRRSVSPLIDVVKETPVQWFETTTPTKRRDQQATEEQQFPPQTTAKKDNKTNLQLVDIITDWDDEEDEEEVDHSAGIPESEPSQESLPEPRASTNSNNHETNLDTMDISSSNLEDSVERLVELPPDPNALIEEEGVLPEEHIYPAAVDEQMPILSPPITTEELVDVLSGTETEPEPEPEPQSEKCSETETPNTVEQPPEDLPPPPATPDEGPRSPDRVITPPIQFTSSAKRRYIQQNEVDLISRLQNDLPLSQASSSEADISSQTVEEPLKSFEKVSETLVEIAQSFRDQPPAAAQPADTTARKLVQPSKRGKKSTVDPVTASYFEAIEKTFAKPKAPPPTAQLKKTEQKRKLYDATLSEVTEDDESIRGQVAKPAPKVASTAPKTQQDPKLRNFKIVVEKLRVEDYLPKKKSQSRPMEPESEVAVEPVVVQKILQKAASKSRRASKDKDPAKQNDSAKKPKGRPRKVRTESVGEVLPETKRPVESVSLEVPTQEVSKKKHKPNLAGNSQQHHSVENLPNGTLTEVVENGIQTDKVVEREKRSKPNQREESQQQRAVESLFNENMVNELSVQKDQLQEKKKSSNPNLAEDSQQQRLDESLSNGTEVVGHDPRKVKVVEKKKRAKPAERKESQQQHRPDEILPTVDGESVAYVKQDTSKDKVVEKKKRTKPTQREESQQQQRPDDVLPAVNGESETNVEQDTPKDKVVEKKKRTKQAQREESQQQQRPDEVLPTIDGESVTDVEQDTPKDKVVEKKKRTKQAQREESQQQQQSDEVLPTVDGESVTDVEQDTPKDKVVEKKKRTKQAQREESQQQQRPDEVLPIVDGESVMDVEQDTPKDKVVEKKKRTKQTQREESQQQQQSDEVLPTVDGESVTDGEQDTPKDKVVEKKKRTKQAQREESQQQQRPDEVLPTIDGESVTDVEQDTPKDKVVEKKKRTKQAQREESQQQQQSDEVLPTVDGESVTDVEQDTPKDKVVEKKKRTKQAQREESQQQQRPDEVLPIVDGESVTDVEQDTPKDKVVEKKKRTKQTQREESQQQQRPDEVLPTIDGESVTDVEQDTPKDKFVEKKKRTKQAQREESQQQQQSDEVLPDVNGESVTDVEHDNRKDKHNEKKNKKKLKPNLAAVSQNAQPEQPPTVSVEVEVQQSSTNVAIVANKQKMRPNFGTKSKQQHAEVAPAVDEESRLNNGTETGPLEPPTVSSTVAMADTEAFKQRKKQSRKSLDEKSVKEQQQTKTVTESLVRPETQLKALKVKVAKMTVIPAAVSMSPASKAILQQKEKQPVVQPSPATARKLFDEPETERVQVAKKSRKAEKKQRADEDSRNKRKAIKRAKLKPSEPIPKVRISAEKDGLYRITTPGRQVDLTQSSFAEQLNVTELDNSANIRSSLEGCQEEFLGFEDDEDTIPNMTVDLSRSNLELIIPLEPARIPKSVMIPPAVKKSRNLQRQSRSPARKLKVPREPRQPKGISESTSEPAPKSTSPERAAAGSQLENHSLPLKKRKSRDSSKEYLPSEDNTVFAKPAPVDLNDSLLIPMLQRVPIADKYVVRSTPDRGTESTTEYDTDDTCATGDNVLIVRKDMSRLNQSRLSSLGEDEREEEEEEERGRILNKKTANRRQSIPLPRFYGDNTFDITWKPRHRAAGASRKKKRRLDNDSGIEEEDGGVVRRSKRTCRISKQILMTNPLIKSAYDRPDYRPMTVEQLLKAEKMAKKLKQEEKVKRQRKLVGRPQKPSRSPRGRKRIQEPEPEAQEEQQQAKRNRIDLELPVVPATSSSSSSGTAASSAEVAVQVDEDLTVQQERQQAQTWMMKLMAENSGREEVMPQATSSGDRMHFTLDHLTFQERNGIQYSFFIYSETENFGFLRFAPAAVKKWTKTADFLLKFLVLNGQLSFQINGKETVTKSGDFLMLPQNTRYRIQNSDEISLVFMIKFRAAMNELPSM